MTVRAALIAVRTAFITAQKSRLYGAFILLVRFFSGLYGLHFIGTENEGVRLLFAGHKFPNFGIKSVVEISCISTVFLSIILLKKIKYLSL